ncbi:hypothetical protein [Microvirga sp. Mcv34]|nr:hypothetical protein [Microvirga sp. Mcv34]
MKRVPITLKWRGPETKRASRIKADKTAQLSRECGWQKPLVKVAGKENQR